MAGHQKEVYKRFTINVTINVTIKFTIKFTIPDFDSVVFVEEPRLAAGLFVVVFSGIRKY